MHESLEEHECKEGLVLYKLPFGTGFIVCGNMDVLEGVQGITKAVKMVGQSRHLAAGGQYLCHLSSPPERQWTQTELPKWPRMKHL
jgi:hypothetical protein